MNTDQLPQILKRLHKQHPNPKTELENWTSPIQFMACVILSAQATDKGVNKISARLFDKYKTANDFANASVEELRGYVSSINFYKTKAKRIIDACKFVLEHYKGELPPHMDLLIKIPGVGRKSANVIIYEALKADAQGVVVDTHITRVSNRLGLTKFDDQKAAEKIEAELKKIVPKKEWKFYSSAVVLHGRYICVAKNPKCSECLLNDVCPSAFKIGKEARIS